MTNDTQAEVFALIAQAKCFLDSLHELTLMGEPVNDIKIDSELGEVEGLIYKARQAISDEWRAIRTAEGDKDFISNLDLEELGL